MATAATALAAAASGSSSGGGGGGGGSSSNSNSNNTTTAPTTTARRNNNKMRSGKGLWKKAFGALRAVRSFRLTSASCATVPVEELEHLFHEKSRFSGVPPLLFMQDFVAQIREMVPSFLDTVSDEVLAEVCVRLRLDVHMPDDYLMHAGDVPDGWYFVVAGSCSVYANDADAAASAIRDNSGGKKQQQQQQQDDAAEQLDADGNPVSAQLKSDNKRLNVIRCGTGFGELGFLTPGSRRNATITASPPHGCYVMFVPKEDYVQHLIRFMKKNDNIMETLRFLKTASLLHWLDTRSLVQLSHGVVVRDVGPFECFREQGELSDEIFVVKEGHVKLVQRVGGTMSVTLALLGPGDCGGVADLIVAKARASKEAYARCSYRTEGSAAKLLVIRRYGFEKSVLSPTEAEIEAHRQRMASGRSKSKQNKKNSSISAQRHRQAGSGGGGGGGGGNGNGNGGAGGGSGGGAREGASGAGSAAAAGDLVPGMPVSHMRRLIEDVVRIRLVWESMRVRHAQRHPGTHMAVTTSMMETYGYTRGPATEMVARRRRTEAENEARADFYRAGSEARALARGSGGDGDGQPGGDGAGASGGMAKKGGGASPTGRRQQGLGANRHRGTGPNEEEEEESGLVARLRKAHSLYVEAVGHAGRANLPAEGRIASALGESCLRRLFWEEVGEAKERARKLTLLAERSLDAVMLARRQAKERSRVRAVERARHGGHSNIPGPDGLNSREREQSLLEREERVDARASGKARRKLMAAYAAWSGVQVNCKAQHPSAAGSSSSGVGTAAAGDAMQGIAGWAGSGGSGGREEGGVDGLSSSGPTSGVGGAVSSPSSSSSSASSFSSPSRHKPLSSGPNVVQETERELAAERAYSVRQMHKLKRMMKTLSGEAEREAARLRAARQNERQRKRRQRQYDRQHELALAAQARRDNDPATGAAFEAAFGAAAGKAHPWRKETAAAELFEAIEALHDEDREERHQHQHQHSPALSPASPRRPSARGGAATWTGGRKTTSGRAASSSSLILSQGGWRPPVGRTSSSPLVRARKTRLKTGLLYVPNPQSRLYQSKTTTRRSSPPSPPPQQQASATAITIPDALPPQMVDCHALIVDQHSHEQGRLLAHLVLVACRLPPFRMTCVTDCLHALPPSTPPTTPALTAREARKRARAAKRARQGNGGEENHTDNAAAAMVRDDNRHAAAKDDDPGAPPPEPVNLFSFVVLDVGPVFPPGADAAVRHQRMAQEGWFARAVAAARKRVRRMRRQFDADEPGGGAGGRDRTTVFLTSSELGMERLLAELCRGNSAVAESWVPKPYTAATARIILQTWLRLKAGEAEHPHAAGSSGKGALMAVGHGAADVDLQ